MSAMQALPEVSTMILDDVRCPWVSLDLLQPWRKASPLAAPEASFNLVVQSNGVLPGPRFPAKFCKLGKRRIEEVIHGIVSLTTHFPRKQTVLTVQEKMQASIG